RHLLYGEGYTIRGVQRILREQGLSFVQGVWRAGAEPPPPELEEDRAGDDRPTEERPAMTAPARQRLGVNSEGRRKLQAVLDDLTACRRLIDDALANTSLPQND